MDEQNQSGSRLSATKSLPYVLQIKNILEEYGGDLAEKAMRSEVLLAITILVEAEVAEAYKKGYINGGLSHE